MPRLLNTSASACKKLMLKAELMGIDAAAMEFQEAQVVPLSNLILTQYINVVVCLFIF